VISQKRLDENLAVRRRSRPTKESAALCRPVRGVKVGGKNAGHTCRSRLVARALVTFAAQSALPCVHTTPLGRDVVPEVYWT